MCVMPVITLLLPENTLVEESTATSEAAAGQHAEHRIACTEEKQAAETTKA